MDEFTHVFSGISLLENGTFAEIYEGGSYLRGSYVSVIAAVIFLFFGEDIIYLKFAIALIGVLNLYLLYRIANIFFKNTLYSSLAILLYGISPLVLFNHFYIRQYIFYELFILLILAVAIKIINLEYEKDYKRSNYYILLFIVINIFIFFTSYDAGRIMMAFYSSILASYCYIAVFNRSKLQYKSLFDSLLSLNLKTKTILVGLSYFFSATIVIILTITGIINLSEITYSSPEFLKYDNLFFNLNLFATTFFLISLGHLLIRWEKYEHSQRIIIISASVLLILNLLLPNDLQNTRSILYIFPIFYIVVTAGVETLSSYSTKKILKPFLVIILLIEVIVSYPPSFIKSPHIPGEIDYIDLTVYQDTLQLCKQSLVLVYSNPGISDFMGIRPDYYLNSKYDNPSWISENPDNRMVKFRQGIYYDTYSNVPLITNVEKLKLIYSTNENICLIQGGLPYSWLNFEMRDFVRENFTRYEITYLTNQDYKRMILYTKHD